MRGVQGEKGQSLIQLAVMMVILIGFAALAIDLGNGYLQRRRMQNAADAGALAGARELCLAQPADVAIAKANEYMTRNSVLAADIDAADITVTGGRVDVRADTSNDTFFAGVFGATELEVAAEAAAVCGRATSACGLWPIAFELTLWQDAECGERLVVWDADNDDDDALCEVDGESRPPCECYQCDLDADGTDDFSIVTETSRGWLDYSDVTDPLYTDSCQASGCGASELVCRIRSDSGGRINLPACIPGIRGVKAGAKDDVDAREDEILSIPLYSSTGCPSGSNCSGTTADTFYVTRFGCILIEGWEQNFELTPKPAFAALGYKKIKSKVIYVEKSCGGSCMTFCGSTDGELPEEWELRAVGLIK